MQVPTEPNHPVCPNIRPGSKPKQSPNRAHFSLSMQSNINPNKKLTHIAKKQTYNNTHNPRKAKPPKTISKHDQRRPPQSPKSGFRQTPFFSVRSRIRLVFQPDVASPPGTACPRRGLRLVKHLSSRKANCTHVVCVSQIKRQSSGVCAKGCSSSAMLFQFGRVGCASICGAMYSRKRSLCRRMRLFFYTWVFG